MTFSFLALALLLQGVPAGTVKPAANGAIAGIVVNSATGDPVANVRVTLARVDPVREAPGFLRAVGRDHVTGPENEVTLPTALLEELAAEAAQDFITPERTFVASLALADVHSVLVDPTGKVAVVSKSAPPIVTDGGGRFTFQHVEPGSYRLIFAANGFVRQDYDQRGASPGAPILLVAGKPMDGLVMRLTPTATISGRITATTGQPLALIPAQLLRYAYDATGKRTLQPILSTRTNDRGEYRFYHVTPGRYYVNAGTSGGLQDILDTGDGNVFGVNVEATGLAGDISNTLYRRYAPIFYPGTTDVGAAALLDVAPGSLLSDIDFVLTPQGLYTLRGRVLDQTGAAPQHATVQLTGSTAGGMSSIGGGQGYNGTDGSFEIRNVPPGSYVLRADLPTRIEASALSSRAIRSLPEAEQQEYLEARGFGLESASAFTARSFFPITVTHEDVDGLLMRVTLGVPLNGRVRLESSAPTFEKEFARFAEIRVGLRSVGENGAPPAPRGTKPDGTFRLVGFPGEYRLNVSDLPAGYYLKAARLGDTDALNRPMTLPPSEASMTLDIVLSPNVGQIDGLVAATDGKPTPGAQVVLIPDRNRERVELFRPVTTDALGRFSIPNVEPGDYHLAAWPLLEPYAFFDPDLIKQAQEKGKALQISESARQTITVELLSAP